MPDSEIRPPNCLSIVDPLASLNAAHDSTLALTEAAPTDRLTSVACALLSRPGQESSVTIDPALWLRRFHPSPDAPVRLLCLPHAGGTASYYFGLSRAVAAVGRADVQVVQYPGRQDRRREPFATDLRSLASGVVASLAADVDPRPLVVFGHSMGSLVAYEVALQARASGVMIERLVVSGRSAPGCENIETIHLRDDHGLLREMRALDGTAADLLADRETLDLILPPLRADYRALETYVHDPARRLGLPVSALVGDSDPRALLSDVEQWAAVTDGPFELTVLPGGHFFLAEQWERMAVLLTSRPAAPRQDPA